MEWGIRLAPANAKNHRAATDSPAIESDDVRRSVCIFLLSVFEGDGDLMKPKRKKPSTVFRIIDRETKEHVGSYSRACCNEYDFESVDQARHANVHGMFENKSKYAIAEYRVTYALVNDDCDG